MSNIAFDGRSHVKRGSGSGTASKLNLWMAWLAFGCALVGGVAATTWFFGDVVAAVAGFLPWPVVPWALIGGIGAFVVLDLIWDRVPNRGAVYGVVAWPSLWLAAEGGAAVSMRAFIDTTNAEFRNGVGPLMAGGLMTLSGVMIVISVVFAEKFARSSAK